MYANHLAKLYLIIIINIFFVYHDNWTIEYIFVQIQNFVLTNQYYKKLYSESACLRHTDGLTGIH